MARAIMGGTALPTCCSNASCRVRSDLSLPRRKTCTEEGVSRGRRGEAGGSDQLT